MKIFNILLLFLAMSYTCQAIVAKPDPEIIRLKERIKNLEDYKTNIDNVSIASVQNIKNKMDEELKTKFKDIESAEKILYLLLAIGLPTTAFAVYSLIWGIKKKTTKLIEEKIESIVEKSREDILRVIETETTDNKLRNNKQLLVISGDEESSEFVKGFLKRLKFKKVIYRIVGSFNEVPEHDLMIFNSPKGQISQEKIDELMQLTDDEDHHYVAYSTERLTPNARLNFSNSLFTLYHNILSTLKYSEIAKLIDED